MCPASLAAVFACTLLKNRKKRLSEMTYTCYGIQNEAHLHSRTCLMPKRREVTDVGRRTGQVMTYEDCCNTYIHTYILCLFSLGN